ncbi:MAG: class I SAM-dependent methyltransferase [Bacteroidota bacterium]
MRKSQISSLLRKFRLLYSADKVNFYIERFKNRKNNAEFIKKNPDINLPPDYLIYESFQIDYKKYFTDSFETAKWLTNHFKKHIDLKEKRILDWGCGPGRIIRHLPKVIGNSCEYYGTDYNKKSIDWCSKYIPNIHFNNNPLQAKLPYEDNFVDIIYGISIFTHLSKKLHYDWYKELFRVLKPQGIMFLTTQGENYKVKLTENELENFNQNDLVVRGNVKEGHRTYSAFHPKEFMNKLFSEVDILEHIETKSEKGKWLPQDIWIIRKR